MRIDPKTGQIVETVERRTSPDAIQSKLAKTRLKRERLRAKCAGWQREDEELAAYEAKLLAVLGAVGIDPICDELPPMVLAPEPINEPLTKHLDNRGRFKMDLAKEDRLVTLARRKG